MALSTLKTRLFRSAAIGLITAAALLGLSINGGAFWGPNFFQVLQSEVRGYSSVFSPTLTAASGATVDNDFDITFTDDPAWRAAVTSVQCNGSPLSNGADWSLGPGFLRLKPAGHNPCLTTSASLAKQISVIATGQPDATVAQKIGNGALHHFIVSVSPPIYKGTTFVTTVTAKDQYNNTCTSESAAQVDMSSSSGNVIFDSNGDGIYGDNAKRLSAGVFTINTRDNVAEATSIFAIFGNLGGQTGILVNDVSSTTDQFRSVSSGSWSSAATWESSHDGSTWFAATLSPTSSASFVHIRNGHTVTTDIAVTVDQLVVDDGGALGANSNLTVANGTGNNGDVAVESGGVLSLSGNVGFNTGAFVDVKTGGTLRIAAAGLSNPTANPFYFYRDGSIHEWAVPGAVPPGGTYFSFASGTPILRFTASPAPLTALASVNGVVEVGSGVTLNLGSGGLSCRNGFRGSGDIVQGSAKPFTITGSPAEIGGSGVVTLGTFGLNLSSASVVTLTSNKTINGGTMTLSGTLKFGTNALDGTAAFTKASTGVVELGSPDGISSGNAIGNIRTTGTRTLNPGTTVYNGGAAQIGGSGMPFSPTNLTVDNAAGVTLSHDVTVSGAFNLGAGNLVTGTSTLTINPGATFTRAGGYVLGKLRRYFSATGPQTFDIGTANGYTPVLVNATAITGTPSLTISSTQSSLPALTGSANKLGRYWTLAPSGTLTANITFNYFPAEVSGTLANYKFIRSSGPTSFTVLDPAATPTTTSATINGVSSFSDWTLAETDALPSQFALTVTKDGDGTGTVTGGGINCGAVCEASYYSGTVVSLTAAADPESELLGWSGGACTGTGTCNVTMNAAKNVTALFDKVRYPLSVVINGTAGNGNITSSAGGIDCPGLGLCNTTYASGTLVTLTAHPAAGNPFQGWSGACTGAALTCDLTMTSAKTVTAAFGSNPTLASDHFRSKASGSWQENSTWESSHDGTTGWQDASGTPTDAAASIRVRGPHTVTISGDLNADDLTVDPGATLTAAVGQTLYLLDGNGTDLTINGTVNIGGGSALRSHGSIANNGALNMGGEFWVFDGTGYSGSPVNYTGGQLFFENATGPYIVDDTSPIWPATNGPAAIAVRGIGGIQMTVPRTIDSVFQLAAPVKGANFLTLNDFIAMDPGASFTGSPTYGPNSTLAYRTRNARARGDEWLAGVSSGPGCPQDVNVTDDTTLDVSAGANGQPLYTRGGIYLFGGSLTMDGPAPMTAPLNVGTDVGIFYPGTLTLSSLAGGDINVGRAWQLGQFPPSTFIANGRRVTLNGSANTFVTGNNTFYDLVITAPAGMPRTIQFFEGQTQTITHSLTITGSAGAPITLASTTAGVPWNLVAASGQSISFAAVQDSDASGGALVYAYSSSDRGGNANWAFPGPTASISGTVTRSNVRGIGNAIVTVTGGGLLQPVTAVSGRNGTYSIPGLPTGRTYTVTVTHPRFSFSPVNRSVVLQLDATNIDFAASP